jgi:hypothetical protein
MSRRQMRTVALSGLAVGTAAAVGAFPQVAQASSAPFVAPLHHVSTVASTVPRNGDVNPYGTVLVPKSQGRLTAGNVLVSNFNNAANQQGRGTTIVQITPGGKRSVFAALNQRLSGHRCPGGVGLTTALVALRSGWVIVGSLPSSNGMSDTAKAGCLIVLDSSGHTRETLTGHGINGPWDATAADHGRWADLFVTNVLNGTVAAKGATVDRGTVLRIRLDVSGRIPRRDSTTVVGSGFPERTDPAALVVGPTGVALDHGDLYVADTVRSRITVIGDATTRNTSAGTGARVSSGGALNGPLGLVTAPGGDLLTVNAGDGNLVELTPRGRQVAVRTLDRSGMPPGAGALFGLVATRDPRGVYFVNDATNTLNLLH